MIQWQRLEKSIIAHKSLLICILFVGVFISLFLLHLQFLSALPGSFDTAELQHTMQTAGVPHVTGYPLLVMMGWVFDHVFPFGTPAFRANLLNLIIAFGSLALFFAFCLEAGISRLISIAGMSALAFTFTFWFNAFQTEVYALHLFFVHATILMYIRWYNNPITGRLYALLAVFGLGFSNHMSMVLLFPGLGISIIMRRPQVLKERDIYFASLTGIVLGLLPYLYVIFRQTAPNVYIETVARNPYDLFSVLSGGNFKRLYFSVPFHRIFESRLPELARNVWKNELSIMIIPACAGLVAMRGIRLLAGITLLSHLVWNLGYAIEDIWPYYAPFYSISFFLALGGFSSPRLSQRLQPVFAVILFALALVFYGRNSENISSWQKLNEATNQRVSAILSEAKGRALIVATDSLLPHTLRYHRLLTSGQSNIHILGCEQANCRETVSGYLAGKPVTDQGLRYLYPEGLPVLCAGAQCKSVFPDLPIFKGDMVWVRK